MSAPYRLLDLFSGIGGFSLGLERSGAFKTVAFCEIDEFPRKILNKHWPEVPIYDDVRKLDAKRLAADGISVSAICGGFPCQDISSAGQRAGLAGERSGLWTEYARLVREIRPRVVIVENVPSLLVRGMGTVLGDLADAGYDADWFGIPAAAVHSPQYRARQWVVAFPAGERDRPPIDPFQARRGDTGFCAEWPAEPDVCRVANGLPYRVDRLKGLGNAVVPQIPELIGRAILRADIDREAARP